MLEIPLPDTKTVLVLFLGILIGLPMPYWYAQERISGFSRYWISKLPYKPPPGMEEEEAMEEATSGDDK